MTRHSTQKTQPKQIKHKPQAAQIRQFASGATRDTDNGKLDFEGFLSPLVVRRYGEYMHGHRKLPDGSLRDSDNWQRGIPRPVYVKSLWRHFWDVWALHRQGGRRAMRLIEVALCAVIFNASGYLHTLLADRRYGRVTRC